MQSIIRRFVGSVYVDDLDVNVEVVRLGAARVYCQNVRALYDLQTEAREAERGLWPLLESRQIPPWRRRRR